MKSLRAASWRKKTQQSSCENAVVRSLSRHRLPTFRGVCPSLWPLYSSWRVGRPPALSTICLLYGERSLSCGGGLLGLQPPCP